MKVEEKLAGYKVITTLENNKENVGWVNPQDITHQTETVGDAALAPSTILPPGWSLATIDQLVGDDGVFVDGDWVESKDQDPKGDVRLIQLANIGDGEYRDKSARFLTHAKAVELGCTFLKKGDVLIARMPDPLGRACIFPGDSKPAVTVVDVAIVRSAAGEFDHRWLMYFVNAPMFRSKVASMQSGSTRKRISRGNLAKIALPIPPLDQQKRIVAEIEKQFSRLDEAVANLKRVKANLKRYKAAVLKAAVEGRLVETEAEIARREGRSFETGEQLLQRILETRRNQWQGKGKYKEPAAPDTNDLPELPEGWVWASLDSLIADGPQNGLYLPKSLYGSGHPILRIDDYQQDWIRPVAELQRVHATAEDVSTYSLRSGDLVINRVNSPSHLGKVAIWAVNAELPMFESNMMRATLSPAVVPDFVATYLRSVDGRVRLTRQAKWAVNQASINQQDVCDTPVPLPPHSEQIRIAAEVDRRLSLLRETENQVEANLQRAERMRQSILNGAFSKPSLKTIGHVNG